jgi:hypothetical protein
MSDFPVPAVPVEPGLTQTQRVIYTFTSPSKTFNDIKRSTSWWLPFLLTILCIYLLFAAITVKVTWPQVAENNIKMNQKQADQMDKLPPEQRASQLKIAAYFTEGVYAGSPILALIGQAIVAGVLLATINFGFGGKAKFWEVFAVGWYAGLPGIIKLILGTVALFVGMEPETFKLNNFDGTNVGYYLNQQETPKALYALATSIDALTIWSLALTAIGLSIVAGTKRSAGYIAVFGWWILVILVGAGIAAAF